MCYRLYLPVQVVYIALHFSPHTHPHVTNHNNLEVNERFEGQGCSSHNAHLKFNTSLAINCCMVWPKYILSLKFR